MAKGTAYTWERQHFLDRKTGAPITQLTSFPSPTHAQPYYQNNFTPDGRTLLVRASRGASRDAPWDPFRVDADGSNLVQLTEHDDVRGLVMAGDSRVAFFLRGATLWRVDLDTLEETVVSRADGVESSYSLDAIISHDAKLYIGRMRLTGGELGVVRWPVDGSAPKIIRRGHIANACDPGGHGLSATVPRRGAEWLIRFDYDGAGEKVIAPNVFAHSCWLSGTGLYQGCARWPDRALLVVEPGKAVQTLCRGPYFWHSASSLDGEWIVADSNWPNEGLFLAHVKSRRFARLCYSDHSAGHPQWSHAHPFFDPTAAAVIYQSDRTGICQVYSCRIPESLKAELSR
jgi:hypothetical protein